MSEVYHEAIARLEADRSVLVGKLDAIDLALTNLRAIAGASPRSEKKKTRDLRPKPRRKVSRPATSRAVPDGDLASRIAEVLKTGPLQPKDVTARVGANVHSVRRAFKSLEDSGVAKSEGATFSRMWMLVNRPAKEAPSRSGPEEHVE